MKQSNQKKYFCSHCGSNNTQEVETGNGGDLVVMEVFNYGEETWDGEVKNILCMECAEYTYPSIK